MDPVTGVLTAVVPVTLVASAVLTYPFARLLLWSYRRSVSRAMQEASDRDSPPPDCISAPPSAALTELTIDARSPAPAGALYGAPWRSAAVYAVAGVAFSVIFAVVWQAILQDGPPPLTRMLVLFWTHYWPAVLTIGLLTATRRRRVVICGGYFAVLVAMYIVAALRNPALRWYDLPLLWVTSNVPAMLVLLAYLGRRIRAVGPLVLAFLAIAVMGSAVLFNLFMEAKPLADRLTRAAFDLGFSASQVFWGIPLVLMLALAVLGWLVLRWLARCYERKRFSDEMLSVDAIWLLFAVATSTGLAYEGHLWFLSGLVAFGAFKVTTLAGFAIAARLPHPAPRTLLLLRVFALGARSERLFDVLRAHWLRQGSMALIAGPDLITRTIEPHELLRFLTGRMATEFVAGDEDLETRLRRLDLQPDPDGRYRVNEFFCRSNTWQSAMRALAARSDAVLMDLRGFSAANRGCLFELRELLNVVDLHRAVLLVDRTTDRPFLSSALQQCWSCLAADSVNRAYAAPAIRILNVPPVLTTFAIRQLLDQLGRRAPEEEAAARSLLAA